MKGKVSLYYNQITIKLQSDYNRVTISYIIVYILEAHSTSSSLKKKKGEDKGERQNERKEKERKEKERKEVEKRRRRKRDGKSLFGREERGRMRGGRKDEEEGKGKEEEKEKQKMEKAIHETHRPLQKIFPSMKLGNNMTPIKGRLGKNTTPTSNNPVKLNQNPQTNSQQR